MHGENFFGRTAVVRYARPGRDLSRGPPRPRNSPSDTLFVGNIAFDLSDKDLAELFNEFDNVEEVRMAFDRRTGHPRGFAHVQFRNVESAKNARELLSQRELLGRQLRVDFSSGSRPARPGPTKAKTSEETEEE